MRELASKMRPSFVIMAWFYARPTCKQGRSHGCTVFGSLGAGISETGTTPRQACRVALRFDASVCHSASLETSQTRRQAARLPRPDTLDAATPHPDCRHQTGCAGETDADRFVLSRALCDRIMPPSDRTWQDLSGFREAMLRLPMPGWWAFGQAVRSHVFHLLADRMTLEGWLPLGCDGTRIECPAPRSWNSAWASPRAKGHRRCG